MKALSSLFLREVRLAARIGGGGATGVVFFLILVAIAPFALGPDTVSYTHLDVYKRQERKALKEMLKRELEARDD